MRATVTKQFRFEASHRLPHNNGPEGHIHGHSFLLEVSVCGPIKDITPGTSTEPVVYGHSEERNHFPVAVAAPDTYQSDVGMVIDSLHLSAIVNREIVDRWNYKDLNHLEPETYPSIENLSVLMWRRLESHFPKHVELETITLWDTDSSFVTITADDLR